MVKDVLRPGVKVAILSVRNVNGKDEKRTFRSVVYDVGDDGSVEVGMPIENGKLILLGLDARFDMTFFTKRDMYQCVGQVKERYKKENLYMIRMELVTPLKRQQRREFFRMECTKEIKYLLLSQEEAQLAMADVILNERRKETPDIPWADGTALDVSAGGMRFVTKEKIKDNSDMVLWFSMESLRGQSEFLLFAHMLSCRELEGSLKRFECRMMFEFDENRVREQLVRCIFDAERMNRRNERGNSNEKKYSDN